MPKAEAVRRGDQKRPQPSGVEGFSVSHGSLRFSINERRILLSLDDGERQLELGSRAAQELADWLTQAATWLRATNE